MTATLEPTRRLVSIGVVAAQVGCSTQTLRDMETRGDIPPAARVEGTGRRFYTPEEMETIRKVREARKAAADAPDAA